MGEFQKKSFNLKDINPNDKGVPVKEVIKLVEASPFYGDLAQLLGVEDIIDDIIDIPGASLLVSKIKAENDKYTKYDVLSSYDSLQFVKAEDESFLFKFTDVENKDLVADINDNSFVAEPIYSSKNDFFESTFGMDKYANSLTKEGHSELVYKNLELIREIFSKTKAHKKVYRVLKDTENKFYLRAIVSDQYNDYNNNITVFLGLIALHQETKKTDVKFKVNRCEYNESFIRIYFEKVDDRLIDKVGRMKYMIELSNDEIKREALRFSGVSALVFGENSQETSELYIKPDKFRSSLLSITHRRTPKKAIEELASLANYVEMENDMYEDVQKISTITKPDQIRFLVETKINRTKQNELKKYTVALNRALNQRVETIHQLLILLNKIDIIVEDIDAKEYLRYLMYEVLIEGRSKAKED